MWWLAIGLMALGAVVFGFGFLNTNIEAPQASDYGNRFIWPGLCIAGAGLLLFGYKVVMGVVGLF